MSAGPQSAQEPTDDAAARTDRAGGRPDTALDAPTVAALVALLAAFVVVAGPAGAVGGLATVAVWYAAGTPYAVAIGHVALVGYFPAGIEPSSLAIAAAGFGALVLASAPDTAARVPRRYAAAALSSAAILGGIAWLVSGPAGRSIPVAAAATLAALAGGAYGLHRYGLVVVLERPDASNDDSATPTADSIDGDRHA